MKNQVLIQWDYPGIDESTFLLERSTDSASTWPTSLIIPFPDVSYTDNVDWYGTYWYRIAALNQAGNGSFSSVVSVWVSPPAFDVITLSSTDDSLYRTGSLLQWNYTGSFPGNTDYFLLERSQDGGVTWSFSETITGSLSILIDNAVSYSNTYWYRITPHCDVGLYAPPSNITMSFIQAPTPQLYAWSNGTTTKISTLWNYLGSYTMSISRSSDGGGTWPVITSVSPISQSTYYYIDDTRFVGQTFTYKIREEATGEQPFSNIVTVTVQPPSSVTTLAFSADGGFEGAGSIPWETHTSSMLDLNNKVRGIFSASHVILGGDNACQGVNIHNGYVGQCFSMIGPSESIWAVMGNHDLTDMGGISSFENMFGYRNNYYTWTEDTVQVFMLYETSENGIQLLNGSAQWTWLSQSVSSSLNDPDIFWRIAVTHAPVISSNFSHPGNSTLAAVPWQQWGINAVLSGHNHAVERLESGSVAFITCGGLSNQKSTYYMTSTSPFSKWINIDAINDDGHYYSNGYIYTLIQATDSYMSMSFYSSSMKLNDNGSTEIVNASMSGNSLIMMKA